MAEDAADGVPDGGGSRVLEVVANIGDPSPREALDAWLENVWTDGEGLPAFSVPLRRDRDGLVTDRLLAPSVVCERLLQVDRLSCSVVYEVSNPGLLTYQVTGHRASVGFSRNGDGDLEMRWRVELTPMAGWDAPVRAFTELSVTTVARAFQARQPRIERVGIFQLRDYSAEQDERLSYGVPVGFRCRWIR
uniref:Uncharacterized protein n=1 Tax=Haptolina ericina TaxID=156174 RepID=A0A7S3EWL6_9EUKA|mmetsp:Transcript_31592/g.71377  ORF Transcript_31592/g.71377 Transcript_31592/m.71377 type:complete len:191 (+) Transcript_31592:306-878(+)